MSRELECLQELLEEAEENIAMLYRWGDAVGMAEWQGDAARLREKIKAVEE